MLAVNVSNPDRPNADRSIAENFLEMATDALKSFGASRMLSCRIWTVIGIPVRLSRLTQTRCRLLKHWRLASDSRFSNESHQIGGVLRCCH